MLVDVINFFLGFTQKIGYGGVFLLMTIESTFIPYPSEIIIPPAAFLAQQGELNIFLVIILGALGSVFGAVINYILSFTLGRKLVYFLARQKWARIFLINEQKIKKAENLFLKNGSWTTFWGRLIPGIRHLISIPAGFSRMPFLLFLFYTFSGAIIWVTILALLGYFFGAQQELLRNYYHELTLIIIILSILLIIYFFIKNRAKRQLPKNKEEEKIN